MKLSLIEKKALVGVVTVVSIFVLSILVIGNKNLWFESKNHYKTILNSAEGLSVGSLVTLSGLRVGEIRSLSVDQDNRVVVHFTIRRSLANKVRKKSIAKVIRSFVIGEKKINIIPGPVSSLLVPDGGEVVGEDSTELTDLLSGENISVLVQKMESFSQGMEQWSTGLAEFSSKVNPKQMASIYQQIHPTLSNINLVAKDGRYLFRAMRQQLFNDNLANKTLVSLNQILTPVAKRKLLMEQVLDNLQVISDELKANPQFTAELVTALKEVVITLKAIQKTWMLKDHVQK
ncbi:MAG: MCE family protein [Bdellovibrionales bacterium]|jgi:phospholipid/cholesterol/gamma-HCH transport system substrate-binding protein|nr:MCE family protein [Bdellovibrionales bacterium]MBT3525442.1 MCE family protein [Bdellovibrionales bacterium]MBT7669807.1 MCE family protein [Bdellovibrionales bacterium]